MNSRFLYCILLCTSHYVFPQVGINTNYPIANSSLHIDGNSDNTSINPSTSEAANDIVITQEGQLAIGITSPNDQTVLETKENSGGILLPRVVLESASNGTTPINNPAIGLIAYNTATANVGTEEEVLEKNLYRWNGSKWKILTTNNNLPTPESPTTIVIKTWDAIDNTTIKSLDSFDFRMENFNGNILYQVRMNKTPTNTVNLHYAYERRIGNATFNGSNGYLTFTTTDYTSWQTIGSLTSNTEGILCYLSVYNETNIDFYTLNGYRSGGATTTDKLKALVVNKY